MSAFDENPFADPSVQQATANSAQTPGLDDYDPFNKQKTTTAPAPAAAPPSQPAVMSPTQEPGPPQYTPTAQQTVTSADFQRRQDELERKAAELARREEELKSSPYNARVNNWPPLPGFLPCQPCFYQDINVDIPVEFQEMVKRLYYLWLFHAALLIGNLFGGTCFLFGGLDNGSMFGLSLVYTFFFIPLSFLCWFRPAYKAFRSDSSFNFMVFFFTFFFIPLSFLCWFRPAYKAFRSDSSFNFMVFFFIFFCQFCFSVVMALGIPGTGGSGLITAIVTFKGGSRDGAAAGGDYFIGFIILLVAFGYCVGAFADFFMLTKIHGYYRATGASLAKAQSEFTSNVLSNEGVRNAAASAAAAGVRQSFQQGPV